MKEKKLVFISAYCQNGYQEDRVKNFVKSQNSKIINPFFNTKIKKKKIDSLESKIYKISLKEENLISKSDEVWILIGSLGFKSPENKLKMHLIEDYSKDLNKSLKYFYIYQSGIYVGKAKPIDRGEIFNSDFYKYIRRKAI